MFGITQEMLETFFIRLLVIFTSFPLHECAHGFVADRLGDGTARSQGRLTLNPLSHLDWTGTIILFFTGFGWARPVPVDMRNFKHPRRDMALVAAAGPLTNILIAFIAAVLYRLLLGIMPMMRTNYAVQAVASIFSSMIFINVSLAVLNLLPLPPLDGSKIIGALLPKKPYMAMLRYQQQLSVALMLLLLFHFLDTPIILLSFRLLDFLDIATAPVSMLFR